MELSRPINVRLPKALHAYLEEVSEAEGVPLSILVRQAAMRQFPLPSDGTNRASDTTENPSEQAYGQQDASDGVKKDAQATTSADDGSRASGDPEAA